jgi:hypothetical protein
MESFSDIVTIIDMTLNTKRKRHIVGGVLLSIAALFGGLAFTTMTLRVNEEADDER